MTKYISCAETAKILRKTLKEAFPGVKFSVRSKTYAMGASINVDWTDGPTDAEVRTITSLFAGATFDGMTDYKGGVVHMFEGEEVHFGADFIFTHRSMSDSLIAGVTKAFELLSGDERCAVLNTVRPHHGGDMMAVAWSTSLADRRISNTARSVHVIRTY